LARILEGGHSNGELLAPRVSFLDFDIWWESRVGVLAVVALWLRFPTGVLFPSVSVLREERLWRNMIEKRIGCRPRLLLRKCGREAEQKRYLDKYERVRLDGFEELTEYVVDERYEIFVRLVLGERLLIREDRFEQVQCGYLAENAKSRKTKGLNTKTLLGKIGPQPSRGPPADAAG